jgi:hypothetical protein
MSYSLTFTGHIALPLDNGSTLFLPPEDNGTPEWRAYQEWLDAGNQPAPYIPPPPAPDYLAFWDALLASEVYGSIRSQAMTSLPMNTLATEFIALIGDAKIGRPSTSAIQNSILALLAEGAFTVNNLGELQAILEAANLDSIYTLQQ